MNRSNGKRKEAGHQTEQHLVTFTFPSSATANTKKLSFFRIGCIVQIVSKHIYQQAKRVIIEDFPRSCGSGEIVGGKLAQNDLSHKFDSFQPNSTPEASESGFEWSQI